MAEAQAGSPPQAPETHQQQPENRGFLRRVATQPRTEARAFATKLQQAETPLAGLRTLAQHVESHETAEERLLGKINGRAHPNRNETLKNQFFMDNPEYDPENEIHKRKAENFANASRIQSLGDMVEKSSRHDLRTIKSMLSENKLPEEYSDELKDNLSSMIAEEEKKRKKVFLEAMAGAFMSFFVEGGKQSAQEVK